MIFRDKFNRVVVEISFRRLQIGTWIFSVDKKNDLTWIAFGRDPGLVTRQRKREQCTKCSRWVLHACEVKHDPDRCMQADGPWDFLCVEFYARDRYR